ncbi:ethionine resistance-conferring protein 1 [Trichomonascus vanleenenianus]|uniref:MATE family efflux transporter n=1 Tax=Trichomonascus vanleenenianus TaxID=2268995 RepID=UPI003ECBA45F
MSSPNIPLLQPPAEEDDQLLSDGEVHRYVDVHASRRFSQSTERSARSSFVQDSVGRRGIVDAFSAISRSFQAEGEESAIEEDYDAYSPREAAQLAREQQALLADNNIDYGSLDIRNDLSFDEAREAVLSTNKVWDSAINQGRVATSIKRELIVLCNNSLPLTVTFLLQYSLPVASVFSVGHLGKIELGAVSLGSMTANITGFAMMQGFATCLDTLCPQAYGAGNWHAVGLYTQKCFLLIISCFIPILCMWWVSAPILELVVPDPDIVKLAQLYLRIVSFGAPGYALFECGKRFVQAQGIFHASTMVLLICAPFNAIMNYVLVWNENIGVGFAGAPIAVVLTNWLMPLLLFLYVYFIDGLKCWNGLSSEALRNWGPMFKLAIPGYIMIEAEFLAFEILTLAAARFSTAALAAQSVLATVTSLTYQIPFAIAIAIATRVANFIGATLKEPAQLASKIGIVSSYVIATFNAVILYLLRYQIGGLFSNDEDVIELVAAAMPICSILQLADSPGCITGGVLRGQGRQHLAGYLNLFFYYAVALPVGFGLAFGVDWALSGLWVGMTLGLVCVTVGETYFVIKSDWKAIIEEASLRERDERIIAHS